MRSTIVFGIGLTLGLAAFTAAAATKPPAKAPPTCAAITFRPLPPGMTDGEQQAGMYKSRHARLELRGEVKQGTPVDYYVTVGGELCGLKKDAKAGNSHLVLYRPTLYRRCRACRQPESSYALRARWQQLAVLLSGDLLVRSYKPLY